METALWSDSRKVDVASEERGEDTSLQAAEEHAAVFNVVLINVVLPSLVTLMLEQSYCLSAL